MHHRFLSEIPQDEYTIIDQIGSGTFSDIFSATHLKTNTNVALKISLKTNVDDYDKAIDQEVKINKSLHHPFICKFFKEFETEHLNIIVMELIDGMTTLDYVNQTHGLPLTEVSNLFTQLLIVIEYLHNDAHITHRDLKLENIMIDSCGHIRLIDFGFSSKNSLMSTLCGSIPYCAPEVLSGQLYTKASDIWSMGVILYSLFDGNLPFFHPNTNTLVSIICNTEPKFPSTFDEDLKDLLIKILNKDPEQRIKIEDIKNHPFLRDEKLLQIDYKSLFSPTEKVEERLSAPTTITTDTNDNSRKLSKPPTYKLSAASKANSQVRKSGFFRSTNSTFNLTDEAYEILHEKITFVSDDVDTSIENRKDFAHNLTKLIESAIYRSIRPTEEELIRTNLSLADNQLSLSSSNIEVFSNTLVNLHIHHTADSLVGYGQKANNHHFALANHFAGLSKGQQKKRPKPPRPAPKGNPLANVNMRIASAKPPLLNQGGAPPVPLPPKPQAGLPAKGAQAANDAEAGDGDQRPFINSNGSQAQNAPQSQSPAPAPLPPAGNESIGQSHTSASVQYSNQTEKAAAGSQQSSMQPFINSNVNQSQNAPQSQSPAPLPPAGYGSIGQPHTSAPLPHSNPAEKAAAGMQPFINSNNLAAPITAQANGQQPPSQPPPGAPAAPAGAPLPFPPKSFNQPNPNQPFINTKSRPLIQSAMNRPPSAAKTRVSNPAPLIPNAAARDDGYDASLAPEPRALDRRKPRTKAGSSFTQHFIAKSHRRHSHNRALVVQAPIVAPVVGPTINLSEE